MSIYPDVNVRKSTTSRKSDVWEVVEDCEAPEGVIIPKGFETDFASVPKALWSLLPPHGKAANAAVQHDFRYIHCWGSDVTTDFRARLRADLYFYRDMVDHGVSGPQAWLMYQAVRWFGKKVWERHRLTLHAVKVAIKP